MRLHAFILAVCVCAHARAASIGPANFDLDNVDLEDEQLNVDNLRNANEVIPVKVVEEPVIDENSNDYIPPLDTNINVKRIEIDLTDTGPPQRQEHETQNPENFSDSDKIAVAIKNTIEQAENVFNEGLKSVSNSFKTFTQANEDLPAIQQNIKKLKDTFTGQIEKLNLTIWNYLKPETASPDESVTNPKLEMVQARLKFLDNNFKLGVDTLTEGVEIYTIIKEEDEAEAAKGIALKADVRADAEGTGGSSSPEIVVPAVNPVPVNPPPANNQPPASTPIFPWTQYLQNWQNAMSSAFTNVNNAMTNAFNGNNNGQSTGQSTNPVINFFQGITLPNIFPGQNTGAPAQAPPTNGNNPAQEPQKPEKPANTQADPAAQPAPPAPWSPQGIIQSVTSTVQSTWNNLINTGQNQQPPPQQQTVQAQPANTNPFQQAIQNIVSFITPQPPQVQQPVNSANNVAPVVAPEKVPQVTPNKPVADAPGSNAVPAPVNEQPVAQPIQVNPVPAQPGPIQQIVQNNPIIKGIQSAVQRIQGPPNPETPREEVVQVTEDKAEDPDPKGHGGYRPSNVNNQGGSSRVEEIVEDEKQDTPSEEKEVVEEVLKPEELKTPAADKTE